jgi:hypothetical protein
MRGRKPSLIRIIANDATVKGGHVLLNESRSISAPRRSRGPTGCRAYLVDSGGAFLPLFASALDQLRLTYEPLLGTQGRAAWASNITESSKLATPAGAMRGRTRTLSNQQPN